jgi:hypothetical protein
VTQAVQPSTDGHFGLKLLVQALLVQKARIPSKKTGRLLKQEGFR